MNVVFIEYDDEFKDIPHIKDTKIILDVKNLRTVSTTFMHKLIDAKDRVYILNLTGHPKVVFEICGLNKIIKEYRNI
jgi:hypothetical protein